MKRVGSDSLAQRDVESKIRDWFNVKTGHQTCPRRFSAGTSWYEVDGYEQDRCVMEIFAHVGNLKSAQKKKVACDILKLTQFTEQKFYVAHKDVVEQLKNSWIGAVADQVKVEFVIYPFTPEDERALKEVQTRQNLMNS